MIKILADIDSEKKIATVKLDLAENDAENYVKSEDFCSEALLVIGKLSSILKKEAPEKWVRSLKRLTLNTAAATVEWGEEMLKNEQTFN